MHIPLLSYPHEEANLTLLFPSSRTTKVGTSFTAEPATVGNIKTQAFRAPQVRSTLLLWFRTIVSASRNVVTCYGLFGAQWYMHTYRVSTSDWSSHEIVSTDGEGLLVNTGETIDASGLNFNKASSIVIDGNGTRHTVGLNPWTDSVVDINGNEITYGANGWTDTLGRVIPGYPTSGNPSSTPGVASTTANCPLGHRMHISGMFLHTTATQPPTNSVMRILAIRRLLTNRR